MAARGQSLGSEDEGQPTPPPWRGRDPPAAGSARRSASLPEQRSEEAPMEEAPMEEAPGDSSARRGWRALRPRVGRPRVAVVATGKARRVTKGAAAETALLACVGPRHTRCSANVAGCWFSLRFSFLSPVAAEFRVVAPTLCCQPLSITVTTLPGCPWRRLLMGPSWLKKFNVIELRRRIKLPTPERDEC